MSWAASAIFFVSLCLDWYRLRSNDGGGLSYYLIFVPVGLLSEVLIGAILARYFSSFWVAQGWSLLSVVGLCAVVVTLARLFGEVAPQWDGSNLLLQVELRYPPGWEPDVEAKRSEGRSCRLLRVGPGSRVGQTVQRWGGADRMERKIVAARVVELAPLLRSSDRTIERWPRSEWPVSRHSRRDRACSRSEPFHRGCRDRRAIALPRCGRKFKKCRATPATPASAIDAYRVRTHSARYRPSSATPTLVRSGSSIRQPRPHGLSRFAAAPESCRTSGWITAASARLQNLRGVRTCGS
jgi:hypothetical protein